MKKQPLPRLAADAPFVVGMVLADEDGRTAVVVNVSTRTVVFEDSFGGYSHAFARVRFPFVVAA